MNIINFTPECEPLQLCTDNEFFKLLEQVNLDALERTLSDVSDEGRPPAIGSETVGPCAGEDLIVGPPQERARRGPKLMPALPFVKLRLWCIYPGIKAPRRLGTLYTQQLDKGDSDLAARCGFAGRIPDRRTTRERFQTLDAHPDLIREALRAISAGLVQHYLMPPEPPPPKRNLRPPLRGTAHRRRTLIKSACSRRPWARRNTTSCSTPRGR